jgi:ABC-2 type transport system permease protein/sodium transport system permease protein
MSDPSAAGLPAGLARLARLMRKELSESLRDRRTILTLVLMPLLLYPVLAMAFQQLLLSTKLEKARPVYRVAFASPEEANALLSFWGVGREHQVRRQGGASGRDNPGGLPAFLEPLPELRPSSTPDVAEDVAAGRADVGVKLTPPGPFRADPRRPLFVNVELYYREGSAAGRDAARYLDSLSADANAQLISEGLRLMRVRQRGDPMRVRATEVADRTSKKSSLVPVLVPLILILMTMTGAVYPAIDLTAGERERGTLEVLVAAPIPRLSVLLAKYVAVLTVAMLTALVNLGTMALTLQVTGIGPAIFGASLTFAVLAQVLALLLLFAAFFSAVLLALTSFARSFKEAQAYLIPLMLFCLTPGTLALMPGLSLRGPLAVAPLVNIVLLARDVFEGAASPAIAGVVVTTTLLYALAAVALAARVFGAEAVLSSETSGWSDLFRRPARPAPAAEPAAALLCLAILFPAYFLVISGLGRLEELDLSARLLLASGVNVVLFMGVPLASAWLGRVELRPGLGLRRPGWQPCAVAVLLGASLWPFVHEAVLLLQRAGIATLGPEQRERLSALVAQWRELPPGLLVGALAVVPAVAEELFFRGYLLSALLGGGRRVGRAVLGSAALFAAFHLLVSDALAVERLAPSFLLGMVLGWLAYASGSVLPGMLLHVLHNGGMVLLGYYEPQLVAAGWLGEGQEHYPPWLLAAAAPPAALGLAWLGRLRRPGEHRQAASGEPAGAGGGPRG